MFGAAAAAGNATERINLCQDYQLPAQYEQYLNTSFLGERMSAQVGTVDFSYYSFGPLQDVPVPGKHRGSLLHHACERAGVQKGLLLYRQAAGSDCRAGGNLKHLGPGSAERPGSNTSSCDL